VGHIRLIRNPPPMLGFGKARAAAGFLAEAWGFSGIVDEWRKHHCEHDFRDDCAFGLQRCRKCPEWRWVAPK
jgi:hypothetical protein